jgi:hypothetical protein
MTQLLAKSLLFVALQTLFLLLNLRYEHRLQVLSLSALLMMENVQSMTKGVFLGRVDTGEKDLRCKICQ